MKISILKAQTKNKISSIQYIVYKILLNLINSFNNKNKWIIYNNNKCLYKQCGNNKIWVTKIKKSSILMYKIMNKFKNNN